MGRPTVKVIPEQDRLVLQHPMGGMGAAYGLDRLCAKLKSRGWTVQRIGANRFRYAYPPAGKTIADYNFTLHTPLLWDV